jgi:hypothetical protein
MLAGERGGRVLRLRPCGRGLLLALVALSTAVFLPSASASPIFRVDWHFSLVAKPFSAGVPELLATGEGFETFDQSPYVNYFSPATAASGRVAVEYQLLKPRPKTVQIKFAVVGRSEVNTFDELEEQTVGVSRPTGTVVTVSLQTMSSNIAGCKVGTKAELLLHSNVPPSFGGLFLHGFNGCAIKLSRSAALTRNSPVHVTILQSCLRAALVRKPVCGGGPARPETLMVTTASTVTSKALVASHKYRLDVQGTVSYWCTSSDPSSCFWPSVPSHPNVELAGVDALYCYATWRCPTPELWRPFQVNGQGLDQLAGQEGQIPYNGGHTYSVTLTGISGPLSFADVASTPTGSFTVTITDLG